MEVEKLGTDRIKEGYHPRKDFTGKEELKESIEKEGLLDPISVRQDGNDYFVIEGVRRIRVVEELGWETVPCIIQDVDEKTAAHLSYIRNSDEARKNLNPIEVALHIREMRERFGYSVLDLVGLGYAKDDQTLYNKQSLLTLPQDLQDKIAEGRICPTIGYELARPKNKDLVPRIPQDFLKRSDLTVSKFKKKVRDLINSENRKKEKEKPTPEIPDGEIPGIFFKDSSDMSELADGSVGLIVTSPPYNLDFEYEKGVSFNDHLQMLNRVFSEGARVLVPGGKICINFADIHNFGSRNGGKPEIRLMGHHYQEILEKSALRLIRTITWKKCTPGKRDFNWFTNPQANYNENTRHGSYRGINNTELIYVFEKNGKGDIDPEIEKVSRISKEEYYQWVDGVWEIPPVKGEKGHPAQFPEEIPRRLIKMYSYKGDIVLDPFGGSMTTVKVANELGRIGVGYEKKEKYKPVIMEKLGIKEADLKKADLETVHKEKAKKEPDPMGQFQELILEILKENNKTTKDLMSAEFPMKSSISKDDIIVEWAPDSEEPDPSGPGGVSMVARADDYREQEAVETTLKKAA